MRTFAGFVDDLGHLAVDDPSDFQAYLLKRVPGCEVVVTVKKKPRRQGTQSMRYYRGVVIPDIALACGYLDPDDYADVHDGLAWKFLRLPDGPFGNPRRQSTAKAEMPQDQMTVYIDQCILWAESSIPGCRVRRPDEVDPETIVDTGWQERAS